MTRAIVSFLAFQICWFACVGGAARGVPWLGAAAVAAYVAVVLTGTPAGRARTGQAWFLGVAGVVGYLADSALVLSGVLTFPPQAVLGWPSTVWMVALWVLQAATLNGAMPWLSGRLGLSALVGAIAGPMAYLAGERMGAAVIGHARTAAVAVIAIEWAIALPLLVWLEKRARGDESAAGALTGARFAP